MQAAIKIIEPDKRDKEMSETLHTREIAAMKEYGNHFTVFCETLDLQVTTMPLTTDQKIALYAVFCKAWGVAKP